MEQQAYLLTLNEGNNGDSQRTRDRRHKEEKKKYQDGRQKCNHVRGLNAARSDSVRAAGDKSGFKDANWLKVKG